MPRASVDVRSYARRHTTLAINTLALICRSKGAPPAARVSAAEALLNRGWGKPQQDVAVDAQITVTVRKLISENQNVIEHEPLAIEDDSDDTI